MSLKLYEENDVQRLADTIRNKNGTTDKYKLSEMPGAVENIRTTEDLNTELTNLESAANNLDLEIDKLPDRYTGQYNVTQIINGDECKLEINEAPTESYYANKLRSIVDGTVTEINKQDLMGVTALRNSAFSYCSSLTTITIPSSVTSIGSKAFMSCTSLTSVIYDGQAPNISSGTFYGCSKIQLYDFRNCTRIPSLANTSALGHASGCQIVVPDALYDEWQQATNWSSLIDVVWVKSSEYVEVI